MNERTSLYDYILQHLEDGRLPDGFSLPEPEEEGVRFADGAQDGITVYHMAPGKPDEAGTALLERALSLASAGKAEEADAAFSELGRSFRAVSIIDEVQQYVIKHLEELSPGHIYQTAVRLIRESADRESVKFGLLLLEMFKIQDEAVKDAILTLGLSDEFTVFAVWNARKWPEGNDAIFDLIQKVRGWGRIHALENLDAEPEEISDWVLLHGVDNDVLPAYSALTAWEKAYVPERLQAPMTAEEFRAVGRIFAALLDEGPVPGISAVENAAEYVRQYREAAKAFDLTDEDRETLDALAARTQEGLKRPRRTEGRTDP